MFGGEDEPTQKKQVILKGETALSTIATCYKSSPESETCPTPSPTPQTQNTVFKEPEPCVSPKSRGHPLWFKATPGSSGVSNTKALSQGNSTNKLTSPIKFLDRPWTDEVCRPDNPLWVDEIDNYPPLATTSKNKMLAKKNPKIKRKFLNRRVEVACQPELSSQLWTNATNTVIVLAKRRDGLSTRCLLARICLKRNGLR